MKINYTLFFSIILATGIVAVGFTIFQVSSERNKLNLEMLGRSSQVSDEFSRAVMSLKDPRNTRSLDSITLVLCRKYRLLGIAYYTDVDSLIYATRIVREFLKYSRGDILRSVTSDTVSGRFFREGGYFVYQSVYPLNEGRITNRAIVVYMEAGYVSGDLRQIWLRNIIRWLIQAVLVAIVTILILRWSIFTPLNQLVRWMGSVRAGSKEQLKQNFAARFLRPLHTEAKHLATAVTEARAAAEEEVKLRTRGESIWTAGRLNEEAKLILKSKMLIVVSNREPYMHIHEGKEIRCIIPASGMVTAMEPILKACGGLWVASGSGDADREVVDDHDKIMVPPEEPKYTLRRLWISKEEEEHFYYGFSNEGLWPLCHVAHTRPSFRTEDWQYYQSVNRKFANAILEEIRDEENPFILVQDYHFALLPAMIKESRPDARVSIFWHIPWPNPESFGICPWQNEILMGMLGADLIGFHTQYHCNNFLSTVNRTLESRVTWESFTVSIGDHKTRVSPFPISISFTLKDDISESMKDIAPPAILKTIGAQGGHFGIGVDRIDYTKGILERFHAIERFMEKYPSYQGNFSFIQIGAPSRTFIKDYSDLVDDVEKEAARINKKFQKNGWTPIILLDRHHSHDEIRPFYRGAVLCMVTSLHDGMNLVAKEFVAARSNGTGVLILSKFTGAAGELAGSLIVNPYDIEEMADAMKTALDMSEEEQRLRMNQMRQTILRNNIYSWAASLLKGMDSA
jgi:trehalose-6-phosphate synthase